MKKTESQAKELWKEASRIKWGERCVICSEPAAHMHHFVPKSRSRILKFDIKNAVPLCQKHHYKIHFSPEPDEIRDLCCKIREARGKKWCAYIDKMRKEICKYNKGWILGEIKKLKRCL